MATLAGKTKVDIVVPCVDIGAINSALLRDMTVLLAQAGVSVVCTVHLKDHPENLVSTIKETDAAVLPLLPLDQNTLDLLKECGATVLDSVMHGKDRQNPASLMTFQMLKIQVDALQARNRRHLAFVHWQGKYPDEAATVYYFFAQMACQAAGLSAPTQLILLEDPENIPSYLLGALQKNPTLDGFCAMDDLTAMAVVHGLRECGKMVPQDASVVGGYDSPSGQVSRPPLSSVTVDTPALAYQELIHIAQREGDELALGQAPGGQILQYVARESV
ncbi:MAG: substrate-binding domain-containing protein [Varibaculum cambriense]|nr:substrate-binding domain-containing protein [Varibaculum cambriense]